VRDMIPVILSGGAGTRLWPLSRALYPKQLHRLVGGEHSLLQQTALRAAGLAAPIVVCNEAHRFMVAEQLRQVDIEPAAILLEPVARNTAPAIALAALSALAKSDTDEQGVADPILIVLPADHVISNEGALQQALQHAVQAARQQNALVTFGIVPQYAETGYGYLQSQEKNGALRLVSRFVEKPDQATAEAYVAAGDYFWNSGMFVFTARNYLAALARYQPAMHSAAEQAFQHASRDLDFTRISATHFADSPAESVDYAIMERADNVYMVPLDAGWSDIGNWHALWQISPADNAGNVSIGPDIMHMGSRNTLVHSLDRLVVTLGLEDCIVVDTPDALLVAHRDQVQQVKQAVARLQAEGRDEYRHHREVHRPWGSYDSIGVGPRYQVKCITVKPGASLSLQMHHHRAEHWIVVSGTAEVQVGEETRLLQENQSTYIPIGATHRLRNPGVIPLKLIEVQSGSYLGEDDIVRYEDDFGRC